MNKKEIIYDELVLLEICFNQKQPKERLMIYSAQLEKYDIESVVKSIRSFQVKNKFFPQLAEIIEDVLGLSGSVEELAISISSEIIELISRFGPYREEEVKNHLGVKFGIVQRFGGWQNLCLIKNDEVAHTRAQLRELAKVFINKSKRETIERGSLDLNLKTDPLQVSTNLGKIDFTKLIE